MTIGLGRLSVGKVVYEKLLGHDVNNGGIVSVTFTTTKHQLERPALSVAEQLT